MRGLRSTVLLVVVLVGLGAYIYFVESKRPSSSDPAALEKVFTVEGEKLVEVRIKSSSGETTLLKKAGTTWQIVEPSQLDVDGTEISSITGTLGTVELQRVVDEAPADLSQYGLSPPRVEITFRGESDKQPHRLLLGLATATGADMYAMRDSDKRVFLVSGYLENTFDRKTFDLRDKSLLHFPRERVDAVDLKSGSTGMHAVKKEVEWYLTSPWPVRADFGGVEGLVGRIESARMKAIVAQEASDLNKFGLLKPTTSITIGAGSAQATLELGGAAEDGSVYARDVSRPIVFTIESAVADELKKAPVEYRRKDVFDFRPFNATRLEIVRAGKTVTLERVKGTGENPQDTWRQTTPDKRDLETAKVDTLLSQLSNLRADSFADTAESGDLTRVSVKFDEGKKDEQVGLVKRGADSFSTRPGEPGASLLPSGSIDGAMKALDEVLAPPPAKAK